MRTGLLVILAHAAPDSGRSDPGTQGSGKQSDSLQESRLMGWFHMHSGLHQPDTSLWLFIFPLKVELNLETHGHLSIYETLTCRPSCSHPSDIFQDTIPIFKDLLFCNKRLFGRIFWKLSCLLPSSFTYLLIHSFIQPIYGALICWAPGILVELEQGPCSQGAHIPAETERIRKLI